MLIFVQYLYGLTWAFSVAYACARLEACAWSKREAVTHYVSRLNPMAYRVHLRAFSFSEPRGKRKYYSVDRDTCNIVTRLSLLDTGQEFLYLLLPSTMFAKLSCQKEEEEEERNHNWNALDKQERNAIGRYILEEIIVSSNRIYR